MKRLDGIYRGYDIFEKDNVWKIELEGKTISTFDKIDGVDGKASCMTEIDRIKREDIRDREINIQRVDAQVKATRDGGV
jgi:uridine phosphorylase